jgi:hypothetical protein
MIGKGAQYLTAAGFGRYRITAASLGSLDLLGTYDWLMPATRQAIMDAFGVDGPAVIRATNEYLNGIAAQGQAGKAKATALAGFINEDPMMVCSLGLEPTLTTLSGMPVRFALNPQTSSSTAYINLNVALDHSKTIIIKAVTQDGYTGSVFGVRYPATANDRVYINAKTFSYGENNTNVNVTGVLNFNISVVNRTSSWTCNGVQGNPQTANFSYNDWSPYLLGIHNANGLQGGYGNKIGTFILQNGDYDIWLVPFNNGGTIEMLDINASVAAGSKVYATRVGNLTSDFALPDGTPWTPPTP